MSVETKVNLHFTPCRNCARRAILGEQYDQSLMILCNGIGHLMVAANRPLCEEPPRPQGVKIDWSANDDTPIEDAIAAAFEKTLGAKA